MTPADGSSPGWLSRRIDGCVDLVEREQGDPEVTDAGE